LVASHQISVQFCSNKVTGMMSAPAFALVSGSSAIAAQCRFLAGSQGEKRLETVRQDTTSPIQIYRRLGANRPGIG